MPATNSSFHSEAVPRYRLRIGVTGHCELPDDPALSRRIQEVLDSILTLFPKDSNIPIVLNIISALAEGADRLVVEETLKRRDVQTRFDAVLPLEPGDYKTVFTDDISRKEFDELLALDPFPVILRDKPLSQMFKESDLETERKRAYREAGEYIVRHCDVLIALWDGKSARNEGGTGQIVALAQKQKLPLFIINTRPPFPIKKRRMRKFKLSSYNALKALYSESLLTGKEVEDEKEFIKIFESDEASKLPPENVDMVHANIMTYYLRASLLARKNQRKYYRLGFWSYTLAAIAIPLVATGVFLPHIRLWCFLLEFMALSTIIYLVNYAKYRCFHDNWISYRFLTERLRAACFSTAIGIRAPSLKQKRDLAILGDQRDWSASAFDKIMDRIPWNTSIKTPNLDAAKEFIDKCWIKEQQNFHKNKSLKNRNKHRTLEFAASLAFYLALLSAAGHVLFSYLEHFEASPNIIEHWLIIAALGFSGFGAAFLGLRKHREYERLAVRSADMESRLQEFSRSFETVKNWEDLKNFIQKLDELMLIESQDWRVLVRFLAPEKPT